MYQIKIITATGHKKLEERVNKFLTVNKVIDVDIIQCQNDLESPYYLAKILYDNTQYSL